MTVNATRTKRKTASERSDDVFREWLGTGERPKEKKKIVQFNWQRHWKKKVEPHLNNPAVQAALDLGMKLYDRNWQSGDPPYLIGGIGPGRIVKGKLSWYQPLHRCHYIAFFSMAIGAVIYPSLVWKFVSGDFHTVPVGCDADGNPRVVMDILSFDSMSGEDSIALAEKQQHQESEGWEFSFRWFEEHGVAAVRRSVQQEQIETRSSQLATVG